MRLQRKLYFQSGVVFLKALKKKTVYYFFAKNKIKIFTEHYNQKIVNVNIITYKKIYRVI